MSKINVDIKPTDVESAYVEAPFDVAKQDLEANGYKIISLRDNALLRKQQGKGHHVCQNGNWVREGPLCAKDSDVLFALNSPLLNIELAREAVKANRSGRYFSTEDLKLYEQYLKQAEQDKSKDPRERQVLIVPRDNFSISPTENPEIFEALFKDIGKDYISFIGQDSLVVYPVDRKTIDSQNGTLLTQIWFGNLGNRSGLDGYYGSLNYDSSRLRGVRYAEGVTQNSQFYNKRDIASVLNRRGITGELEKNILNDLN